MKKVTVFIPCYNEADAIGNLIRKFPHKKLASLGYELDILVIDNNSTDDTAAIARAAGARVLHEPKKGKGNAVRAAFYALPPDTDYAVMLDGDDTYKPEEIARLLEPIDSGFAKIIIGSRMHGRIHEGSMKKMNHFGNRVYSRLVRTAYNVKVTDVLTGYYAWSRDVIENLRDHLQSQDFTIEMEMMTKMARLGYEIYSVPVSYDSRLGNSSLRPFKDGARIMVTYVRNMRWKPVYGPITDRELLHDHQAVEDSLGV
ncbi:MAG TPA: glycosyltransferase family 2 protein [Candidatus Saccharimonadales bacterium]|nr:glycosyltransferase family 2 protein [Candidatus Saccharimonadales bacterium]